MEYTRVYCDAEGGSHFEDVEIELTEIDFAPPAPPLNLSSPIPTAQCVFGTAPASWYGDWHPTPRRQFYIQISGEIEAEVSDGEVRRFGSGSIVLLEDVTGRGHVTSVIGDTDSVAAFLQLPE